MLQFRVAVWCRRGNETHLRVAVDDEEVSICFGSHVVRFAFARGWCILDRRVDCRVANQLLVDEGLYAHVTEFAAVA